MPRLPTPVAVVSLPSGQTDVGPVDVTPEVGESVIARTTQRLTGVAIVVVVTGDAVAIAQLPRHSQNALIGPRRRGSHVIRHGCTGNDITRICREEFPFQENITVL